MDNNKWCKKAAKANSCGQCESDVDCGNDKFACWADKDPQCLPTPPSQGGFCAKWAQNNSCGACKNDQDCGNELNACWGKKDSQCMDNNKWCKKAAKANS